MPINIKEIIELVKTAAQKEIISKLNNTASIKKDGSFVTEIDIAVQNMIQDKLFELTPEIPFFAEENSDQELLAFLDNPPNRFWCLDPVDGTSNLVSRLPYFAISLALIENGQTSLGIVYDPNRDECFVAQKGQGAFLNNKQLHTSQTHFPLSRSLALVDLKRLPKPLLEKFILNQPYHSQRSLGSVALDWCWLACDRFQVYIHGKQRLWDYAAGLLIAEEAGCYHIGMDKKDMFQLTLEPRQAIGAVDESLFKEWTDFIYRAIE
ncbi:MAG: inositol monophosphatase family protein [Gammaproteobacteria bacterium]|nr:inositol monophosphatase family protein [Gammaproteobacteria bacterium]